MAGPADGVINISERKLYGLNKFVHVKMSKIIGLKTFPHEQ